MASSSTPETKSMGGSNVREAQDTTSLFDVEDGTKRKLREKDPHRLEQRQKAIDKGKNTRSYQAYVEQVPKDTRPSGTAELERQFPRTPDKFEICSKRAWDGKVQAWRLRLHAYNPRPEEGEEIIQLPTSIPRSLREDGQTGGEVLLDLLQGKKRDRDCLDGGPSAKRTSLGAAGDLPTDHSRVMSSNPPVTNKIASTESPAPDQKAEDPKSIFDEWEEDEEVAL